MTGAGQVLNDSDVPLCVDLDGTLIKTDLLLESLLRLLKQNWWCVFLIPLWLVQGRACLKRELAARLNPHSIALPYNEPFLEFLRAQKNQGRRLILATASDHELARKMTAHLGLFAEVLGSDGRNNLRGASKLQALAARFGPRRFDYAGNSHVDLAIWRQARAAIVVNAGDRLVQEVRRATPVSHVFNPVHRRFRAFLQALRPQHWIKNLIIFVPLLTAHQLGDRAALGKAALAFFVFCLSASTVYMLNDLLDLDADRHHPTKRLRPLASGELPLAAALVLLPVLFFTALTVAWNFSPAFAGVIVGYFAATTAYSWRLKQVALLDVFVLAGLYTLRLVAGHVATGIAWSVWLLVFSMFVFLSLALMKRFQELQSVRQKKQQEMKGRGYAAADLELVATLGLVNGCLAVLVFALYVNGEQVTKLYAHPTVLLLVCPLLLYWISRVWFLAHRGQMRDDPTEFAFKDWVSYLVGGLTLAVMWLATGH